MSKVPVLNYKTNIEDVYSFGRELGKGGNGVVRVVTHRETGEEFACKSIQKVLQDASDKKKQGHLESIRREVAVLTRLRGSLNVVKLEDVYEDEQCVHLVMEMCQGGELWHRIGERHYSERTVASFMRAVLRTLAQCHANNIVHRDIKPGNFMLLSADERSPVKAIDFGLAATFHPQQLPRTDLSLEGTPWYMAPETLRGEASPAGDIWAAGVMAFQLLSGRFPFDDKKNTFAPAITAIWRSVLNDPLDFSAPSWAAVSPEARDFCRLLLNRDAGARPSAREALRHPWLRGDSSERSVGKELSRSVVARIQRFSSGSLLRRSVLQSIAAELISHHHLHHHHLHLLQLSELRGAAAGAEAGTGATAAPAPEHAAVADVASGGDDGGRGGGVCGPGAGRGPARNASAALGLLLSQLRLEGPDAALDERQLGEALRRMGFQLAPSEVTRLMEGLDTAGRGSVGRSHLVACLLDWRHLQRGHTDLWLQLAEKAFRQLDSDGSGVLEVDELLAALRDRLPPEEVRQALEEALAEAARGGGGSVSGGVDAAGFGAGAGGAGMTAGQGIDFDAFVSLLKVGSHDSLELYDDRTSIRSGGSRGGSVDRYNALLAGSSHRRTAVLATSCSTIATADWSRHGPGGSRHGGSRHGPGGDASTHSCVSDRSDVSTVQDNDRSQHGCRQLQPPGSIAFRFDTDRTDKSSGGAGGKLGGPAAGATTAATSTWNTGTAAAAAGGMVWRFDVGGPKAPPPLAAPVWCFDVGSGGSRASRDIAAPPKAHEPAALPAAGGGLGGLGGVRQQGGSFDRRMHGSNLYRNVALRALQGGGCLDTVVE